ncbi:MAG: hypothetical protein DVB23_001245 [Verrucomicrobia bacterium]|nr:MAG: hypothetical protein DVB23_001245 [Verrucomicrobiota bacterium]
MGLGVTLAAFLRTLGCLALCLTCGSAQPADTTLSASLQCSKPEPILFPGTSVAPALEVALHPNDRNVWDKVRIRLVATMDNREVPPETLPLRITTSGGKPIATGKWQTASLLGLGSRRGTISLRVAPERSTGESPLLLSVEAEVPGVVSATTVPVAIRCAEFLVTDWGDPALPGDDRLIADGDTAWLTHYTDSSRSLPIMPRLVARMRGLPADTKVEWRLESRYPRRGEMDHVRFPEEGWVQLGGDQDWKAFVAYHDRYFGGDAQLSVRVTLPDGKLAFESSRKFRILCQNPPDQATVQYIKSRQGRFWYAWAIAQHESRQWKRVFNQFNEGGRVPHEPNFGAPDGWGMFQIDSARGAKVTTAEVWDWRTNARAGLEELATAESDTRNYFLAIQRNYPDSYEPPPATYTPPDCETSLTAEEASIIQCYNGAAVIRKLRNVHGTFSYYRSCWAFNPSAPSGKRWRFVENRNRYVYKIVKHELEGEMPVE